MVILPFFLILLFSFIPFIVESSSTENVSITAIVLEGPGNTPGNTFGYKINLLNNVINFKGSSRPLSPVFIFANGEEIMRTTADLFGLFNVSVFNIDVNKYTFLIYAEDFNRNKSSIVSIVINVTKDVFITIDNINLYFKKNENLIKEPNKITESINFIKDKYMKNILNKKEEVNPEVLMCFYSKISNNIFKEDKISKFNTSFIFNINFYDYVKDNFLQLIILLLLLIFMLLLD